MKARILSLLYFAVCLSAVQAQTAVKKVLIEEFTTTHCGNCPPSSLNVNDWHQKFPANSVLMTIHEGSGVDAMSNSITQTIFNAFRPSTFWFAPALMINRAVYPWLDSIPYMSVGGFNFDTIPRMDSVAVRIMNEAPEVDVQILGTYNSSSRLLNVTVEAVFLQTVAAGPMTISLYLAEDSITGSGYPSYDQKCYDASWANTHYSGMYNSSSSTIIGYPHRHVMRDALLGVWGQSGGIPSTSAPNLGQKYTASTTFTVPAAYNDKRLTLVAFVARNASGKKQKNVLNANSVKLSSAFSTSVEDAAAITNTLELNAVYPVPVTEVMHVDYKLQSASSLKIEITSVLGQTTMLLSESKQAQGPHRFEFDTRALAAGIYYLTLSTSGQRIARKVIKY